MDKSTGKKPLSNITNVPRKKPYTIREAGLSETEENVRLAHLDVERSDICYMHKYSKHISQYYESLDIPIIFDETKTSFEVRTLLVDWVISCHEQLALCDDTLYFAVFIIDRFLSLRSVAGEKLQLVGISALMIASKYEEVLCPDLRTFTILAGRTFDEIELKKAEKYVLSVLKYKLEYVNPLFFLRRAARANHYESRSRKMGKYFLELMMLHKIFCKYSKSIQSATAMYLARKICNSDYNKNLFFYYARVTKADIRACFEDLVSLIYIPAEYESIESKYSKPSSFEVSTKARQYAKEFFK